MRASVCACACACVCMCACACACVVCVCVCVCVRAYGVCCVCVHVFAVCVWFMCLMLGMCCAIEVTYRFMVTEKEWCLLFQCMLQTSELLVVISSSSFPDLSMFLL